MSLPLHDRAFVLSVHISDLFGHSPSILFCRPLKIVHRDLRMSMIRSCRHYSIDTNETVDWSTLSSTMLSSETHSTPCADPSLFFSATCRRTMKQRHGHTTICLSGCNLCVDSSIFYWTIHTQTGITCISLLPFISEESEDELPMFLHCSICTRQPLVILS